MTSYHSDHFIQHLVDRVVVVERRIILRLLAAAKTCSFRARYATGGAWRCHISSANYLELELYIPPITTPHITKWLLDLLLRALRAN